MQYLIDDKKCDPNCITDIMGQTPLHAACRYTRKNIKLCGCLYGLVCSSIVVVITLFGPKSQFCDVLVDDRNSCFHDEDS